MKGIVMKSDGMRKALNRKMKYYHKLMNSTYDPEKTLYTKAYIHICNVATNTGYGSHTDWNYLHGMMTDIIPMVKYYCIQDRINNQGGTALKNFDEIIKNYKYQIGCMGYTGDDSRFANEMLMYLNLKRAELSKKVALRNQMRQDQIADPDAFANWQFDYRKGLENKGYVHMIGEEWPLPGDESWRNDNY